MILTLPVPITDKDKKLAEIFIFTLFCSVSNAFKAFIKPSEAPQRKAEIKP